MIAPYLFAGRHRGKRPAAAHRKRNIGIRGEPPSFLTEQLNDDDIRRVEVEWEANRRRAGHEGIGAYGIDHGWQPELLRDGLTPSVNHGNAKSDVRHLNRLFGAVPGERGFRVTLGVPAGMLRHDFSVPHAKKAPHVGKLAKTCERLHTRRWAVHQNRLAWASFTAKTLRVPHAKKGANPRFLRELRHAPLRPRF